MGQQFRAFLFLAVILAAGLAVATLAFAGNGRGAPPLHPSPRSTHPLYCAPSIPVNC